MGVLYIDFYIGNGFEPYICGFLVSQHANFMATRLLLLGISAVHFAAFTELSNAYRANESTLVGVLVHRSNHQ